MNRGESSLVCPVAMADSAHTATSSHLHRPMSLYISLLALASGILHCAASRQRLLRQLQGQAGVAESVALGLAGYQRSTSASHDHKTAIDCQRLLNGRFQ
jgi:hypothetical protein